jgi:hypothetical protein
LKVGVPAALNYNYDTEMLRVIKVHLPFEVLSEDWAGEHSLLLEHFLFPLLKLELDLIEYSFQKSRSTITFQHNPTGDAPATDAILNECRLLATGFLEEILLPTFDIDSQGVAEIWLSVTSGSLLFRICAGATRIQCIKIS